MKDDVQTIINLLGSRTDPRFDELLSYLNRHWEYVDRVREFPFSLDLELHSSLCASSLKAIAESQVRIVPLDETIPDKFVLTLRVPQVWLTGNYNGDIELDIWNEIIRATAHVLTDYEKIATDSLMEKFTMEDSTDDPYIRLISVGLSFKPLNKKQK